MIVGAELTERTDTTRVADLRRRVRDAMEVGPAPWRCPPRIADSDMAAPLPVRKALAVALKLAHMPTDLWRGQLFAGSMTLEDPRIHAEWDFPDYVTEAERALAAKQGLSIHSVFGHIVPDYPSLLSKGLRGIRAEAEAELPSAKDADEVAFLRSVIVAVDGVMRYAQRLADRCDEEACRSGSPNPAQRHREMPPCSDRAAELRQMAANLRQVPAGPAQSFWQALQSVWLLHMVFHSTMDGNAMGRLDQYVWPFLEADLASGALTMDQAAELVDCFCLKFNERAQTLEEQMADARRPEPLNPAKRTRHYTSSQIGTRRDDIDATNHWLQNIVVGGLTPEGEDGTNPLSFLLLDSYRRNQMTNPLLVVRLHRDSPAELVRFTSEVLKQGGGMPALFNDEALVPALERLGIPQADARDYTNDGCWEVIIPGRTDFKFQRLSLMLCLEWALSGGRSRLDGSQQGPDTGDARAFTSYEQLWSAFLAQVDAMVGRVVRNVVDSINERSIIAPVPLLSALIEGCIAKHKDLTAGGAKHRTFGMLAESAAHAIDSLTAIKTVVFERGEATMTELCDALDRDFEGFGSLRQKLLAAPKYGNDDEAADSVGRAVMEGFTETVARHAESHLATVRFPAGIGTFSWYVGIGEGLGASADGRLAGEPVSSNASPALGRDMHGIPGAVLSYSKFPHDRLPAGSPLDLRIARRLVEGEDGTDRMAALIRSFVDTGGAMMTLTVADTEELRAAQREPDKYRSLRVRMGGWCAYFTMLSREQQDHHIRR
ncbi:MAG: pyruvate formate lyase family protein, partial [Armatimonadota bacterium]